MILMLWGRLAQFYIHPIHGAFLKSIINMAILVSRASESVPRSGFHIPHALWSGYRVEGPYSMSSMTFCPCCFWLDSAAEGMGTAQARLEGGGRRKSRGLWPEELLRGGCLWQVSKSARQCISGLIYSFTHLSFLHSSVAYWVPSLQMP